MKLVDNFLNSITMYRLVLYFLILLLVTADLLSCLGLLPFNPLSLIISTSLLVGFSWLTSKLFSNVYQVPANTESALITGLILSLIITPTFSTAGLFFFFWAAVLSQAGKYIFAINHKHIFNPAALAVVLTATFINQSASWWVGSSVMMPLVLIGGFLVVRKIRRFSLVLVFLIVAFGVIAALSLLHGFNPLATLKNSLLDSPVLFFASIMLTEPLTTPPTKRLQLIYGALTGFLFAPNVSFLGLSLTPEMALLAGNIFSYLVSPKWKLDLKLKEKVKLSPDLYDFVFSLDRKIDYQSGQYLEWTLGHQVVDSRGNRRYFTLASSPTEDNLRIGVKFYQNGSSFKKALLNLKIGDQIIAGNLSGDFTLPADQSKKLVFIAGGIGATPFRSMAKYLIDSGQKRDAVLFYSCRGPEEFAYHETFNQAAAVGLKTVYVISETNNIPANWRGQVGRVDMDLIKKEVPDFKERWFYLSGPHTMVASFEKTLREIGIPESQVITDFFPGYA